MMNAKAFFAIAALHMGGGCGPEAVSLPEAVSSPSPEAAPSPSPATPSPSRGGPIAQQAGIPSGDTVSA